MHARILALLAALFLVFSPTLDALAKSSGGGGGSRGSFSSGGSRSSGSSSGWSSSSKPSGTSSGWSSGSSGSSSSTTPSGSSGSSGASSGSSGWSTTNRQAAPPAAAPSAPAQSQGAPASGWSNSSGASQAPGAKPGSGSAFSSSGSDAVKRQGAAASYKDYQGQFSKGGNAVSGAPGERPILNPNRTFNSYGDYNRYRDNYYSGRGWSAPGYAFGSFSSFGMWDAMFMWFMLSHLSSGPGFFYNHQSDPGVQAFQKEAQRLSESNADLKKQLDEMNGKLDEMKKTGVAPDPNKPLPADVDPDVALAKPKILEASEKSSGGGWLLPATAGLAAALAIGYFLTRRRSA